MVQFVSNVVSAWTVVDRRVATRRTGIVTGVEQEILYWQMLNRKVCMGGRREGTLLLLNKAGDMQSGGMCTFTALARCIESQPQLQ